VKNRIRPPVKIDEKGRVIRHPGVRAHSWRLNIPASVTGLKKERKFFASESEAKTYAEGLLAARADAGQDIVKRLRARGMSVTEALEYALKHSPTKGSCTIENACLAYVASRKDDNRKPSYLDNLTSQFRQIEEEFGADAMVDTVKKKQIETFLKGLTGKDGDTPATPKSRINYIITLSALFNFAVEEGWRGENPAAKIRRPKRDEVLAAILVPKEVKQLLEEARKSSFADIFPAILIQMFAGTRRSEIPHIHWDWIRDQYLRLEKTKIRKKRAVDLSDALLEWLAPFRERSGPIFAPEGVTFDAMDTRGIENAYTYRLSQVAEAAKVTLPKNVLRHTAITYRDALTGDLAGTASWAGNSVKVIEEHYRGAATKADALQFYAIKP